MSYFPTRRGPPPQNQKSAYGPAMTDASIYPFKWTPAFGTRMRQLRRQLGDPPYEIVEDAGGPTVLEQTFIEKGPSEGVSPGWVIEDTLRQYAQAYNRLTARRYSEARELCKGAAKDWPTPSVVVDESFVMALGEAGAAASDLGVLEERSRQIDEAARTLTDGRNKFVLGALADGGIMNVGCLRRFFRGEAPESIAREQAKADEELFYQHVAMVAGRHPTISVSGAFSGNALARHWHSEDSVKRNVLGKLDPIDGIRSLTAARQRAIALKADEERLDAVAPMIVLINALTDQLNAQNAESTLTALDTWRRFKGNPGKWHRMLPNLPGETWGALPDIGLMVEATGRVLSQWEHARQDAPYELTYELGPDKRIEWTPTGLASPPRLSREAGDLWLVGETPGTYSAAMALIRAIGEPALHFREEDETLVTMDSSSHPSTYQWCPSGVTDNIALVHLAGPSQGRWRAVQIY